MLPGAGAFSSNLFINIGFHALRGAAIGAVTGGISAEIMGGEFSEGARLGAITGGAFGTIQGVTSSEQFSNFMAGNGFRSNAQAEQRSVSSLDVDKGKTISGNSRLTTDKSTREWQVKDTAEMYKKYGSEQIKQEIGKFEKYGKFTYNDKYEGTGQFYYSREGPVIEFGSGNWDNPWSGYVPGRQGIERTLPHEIYHFMHNDPYAVEEPIAQQFGPQQREILKQNRGW